MFDRRTFLKTSAATGLVMAAPGLAAPAIAQGAKIKLGYVSPQTGPLAGFAESDAYNIAAFLASEDAAYMTGSTVTVDGGVLVQQRSPQVETFPVETYPSLEQIISM